jgi:hypothetical protein
MIEGNEAGKLSNQYGSSEWLFLYEKVDLEGLYQAWCRELTSRGIDYLRVDSNDLRFRLDPEP